MMKKKTMTNNDQLMRKTGLLIVYAWVLLAVGFFLLTAWDTTYLDSSEQYVSILAIIGGPALLIVTKILETWNQEKGAELQDYEAQASHLRAMDEIRVRHEADMERNPQAIGSPAVENSHGSIQTQVASLREEITKLQQQIKKNNKSN
jgi:hypothetical protein